MPGMIGTGPGTMPSRKTRRSPRQFTFFGHGDMARSKLTRPVEREEVTQRGRSGHKVSIDSGTETETFRDAFQNALEGDFNFEGSFSYGSPLPQAPNPCIAIENFGFLGFPFDERDAKLIIERSAQRPPGHDERTLMDTWKIEPTKISFHNPAWDGFLVDLVKNICKKLGVKSGTSPPRLQMDQLLLYQPGSQFLAQEDTRKVDGMFATVVVILPSLYTGGQVHVSHAGSSIETFDFAPNSLTTMCALAWYTDVLYELQPITSGYRLVLTYHLIHTAPEILQPRFPYMRNAATELHSVLQKKSEGRYPDHPELRIFAYLLKHQYDDLNLKMDQLKGADAHKASHLHVIAQQLGYVVGLATLRCHVVKFGQANLDGWGWDAASDDSEDELEDDGYCSDPSTTESSMAESANMTLSIENLVDLSGSQIPGISKLELIKENLIPEDPFKQHVLSDSNYEGYFGNSTGRLGYYYRWTVMVLFHRKDKEDIRLFIKGIPYAMQKLNSNVTQDATAENYQMVEYILRHADCLTPDDMSALCCAAGYGLQWKDVQVWKRAVRTAEADRILDVFGKEVMLEACEKFSFNEVREVLEDIVEGWLTFTEQVNFIEYLRRESSKPKVVQWCSRQTSLILVHLKPPTDRDVDAMMSVIATKGLSVVVDALSLQVGDGRDSFNFWVALIAAVHGKRGDLIGSSKDSTNSYDGAMAKCIDAASRQCPFDAAWAISPTNDWESAFDDNVFPMLRLMDLCLATGNVKTCAELLSKVTASISNLAKPFKLLYIPFLSRLRRLLDKHHIEFCSPPFQDFATTLVERYLSGVLGAKPSEPNHKMRKIGCGCTDCQALDKFLMSDWPTTEFRMRPDRRAHLVTQALTAKDLIAIRTGTTSSSFSLGLMKRTEISNQWMIRLKMAEILFSEIGDERMVARVMGTRYGDVQKALDGTQAYIAQPSVTGTQQTIPTLESGNSQGATVGPIQSSIQSTSLSFSLKRKRKGDM